MRIVIDLQGAQTESRFRGIGRYTLSLIEAMIRHRGGHEIVLALNGLLPDSIQPIRAALAGLLPPTHLRVWYAPGPVREDDAANLGRRDRAELIREAFLASLAPDIVFIPSLFEGFIDDAVVSIGRFDRTTPVCVTIHDLIPLLNPEHYLKPQPAYDRFYQRKARYLRQADLLLAVSESSRAETLACLDVAGEQVVNTSEGVDGRFKPSAIPAHEADVLRAKWGCARPFVLYTGGTDERKNLPRLLEAYAALPRGLRNAHQLVLAGKSCAADLAQLRSRAKALGLGGDEVVFTGYIPDEELVQLYTLCRLFVFPSWHEGFGLPALEAMACGAAVIAANTSSLPEVVGREDALFDPMDARSIASRMAQALGDDAFRAELQAHGRQQAARFSWDESARRAWAAFERLWARRSPPPPSAPPPGRRPRLAFVSPLPPERTGIADYSAELLPALATHYDLEVVVDQAAVSDPWIKAHCPLRDVPWLLANRDSLDRVVYQMGNSPFHWHMVALLQAVPGTVVLHDFYLSGLMSYQELCAGSGPVWTAALYAAHGYGAVRDRYLADIDEVKRVFPANLDILRQAQGVIVHSEYSRRLAQEWYGPEFPRDWAVIPHLRIGTDNPDRASIRVGLGLAESDFLVCSFGLLGETKQNHRLLAAWLASDLARSGRCKLVFVGENHGGDYGAALLSTIHAHGLEDRIAITGWADTPLYRRYLAAADLAVQLRAHSRGETSGTVLDCMAHGLPTVVNANGSMAELPQDAVWMLADGFADADLVEALETLWRSAETRAELGANAREVIATRHSPAACAARYATAIEHFHHTAATALPALIDTLAATPDWRPTDAERAGLARALAADFPPRRAGRRLLLDVSATCHHDLKTGIERVVRALTLALLNAPPAGFRVEPVYLEQSAAGWQYRYARRYALELLGCPPDALADDWVEPDSGDLLVGLDISGDRLIQAEQAGLFAHYRNHGVRVYFMVHDLLPVRMPEVFAPGAEQNHARWLRAIAQFDGAVCISQAVADDLAAWLAAEAPDRADQFHIGCSHHGADFANSAPSMGLPEDADAVLAALEARPSFLMVGTVEPRKGYLQAIQAFFQLWDAGVEANLVIVGKEGWGDLPDPARRDIPETVQILRQHPQLGQRLFWLEGISDEYLGRVYAASACLIAASLGEGFGLPLIEAARHGLPIIARDIPVFREVARDHAFFFEGHTPEALTRAVRDWLELWVQGAQPRSQGLPWRTWAESAQGLLRVVRGDS
ncbi:Glycosyltransferase involved in cell wall bisynthesis [Methylomagnum ishizawai]|uniref:Glycosyltransferase involved in cell wall bisynthesis n=1 Tax=Methylomagnum ishizawai TaxID=1760988 RepID=A0A1Y6D251_9GAMM|nr:glycosyltransferase [Methylomagnum ishizawai]SMF94943.1 Glycosyltransferase involved in cell wall bisynthesis [Methylomagnum ishizawai]